MKKTMAVALVLVLCLSGTVAWAAEPLDAQALLAWRDMLWQVMRQMPVENDPAQTNDPDGADTWLFAFPFGLAELTEPELHAEENPLAAIEITNSAMDCPRGLRVGDTLEAVLAAYPNNNPDLEGSAEYAALYLNPAQAPDKEASWGWIARQNRTVWSVSYTVSQPASGMDDYRREMTLTYVMEDGKISAIRADGFAALVTLAESQANYDAVSAFAAMDAFGGADQAVNSTDTLEVAGLDFRTATPEEAIGALGTPLADELDSMAGVRTLTYTGMLVEFMQLEGRWRMSAFMVSEGATPGPMGIRIGDSRQSVEARFGIGDTDEENLLMYTFEDAQGMRYALTCTLTGELVTEYLLYLL